MTDTQYYSSLTSSGHQANIKTGTLGLPVLISRVAFGSGNTTPIKSATALVKEEIRVNINSIIQNETGKSILGIEAVIPSSVGGFSVNEATLYLEDGTLYAVASLPTGYEPSLDQDAGREFASTIFLASVEVENVTLKIDDSTVSATRKYIQNELEEYALKDRDKTQIFKIEDAVRDDEAVNKKQLNETAEKINNAISNIRFLLIGTVFGGCEDDNPNFIAAFGGTFKKADYPRLWEYASTHPNKLKTLARWNAGFIANSRICDYYCEVDNLDFRAPSLDGAFVRFSSRVAGSCEKDIFTNHSHRLAGRIDSQAGGQWYLPSGTGGLVGGATSLISYEDGIETRPKNIAQKPLIIAK